MALRLGAAVGNNVRQKSNDALVDSVDSGTTNSTGRLLIYSGAQPATPQTTASGTLLVTINFASTAFTASDANGSAGLTGGTPISATVTAPGTAGWFRITDKDNLGILDGAIATSGAEMNFDNVDFVAGGTAKINTLTISTPM